MSASNVIRWAGLSLVVAGVLNVITPMIHPPNDPSSVALSSWTIAHYLLLGGAVFALLGVSGMYARQVEEAGLLGLVGFLMFYVGLAVTAGFFLFEALVMPVLATEAPQSIAGFLPGIDDFGVLGPAILLAVLLYSIGGLLFGIAIIRAGILPRWAAILFVIGIVATVVLSLVSETVGRTSGVLYGVGLAWLGYALWSERREKASEPSPAMQS